MTTKVTITEINGKIIQNYVTKYRKNGIITLIFNLKNKYGCSYYQAESTATYFFENGKLSERININIVIPPGYIRTKDESQNQIYFYYIPEKMLT